MIAIPFGVTTFERCREYWRLWHDAFGSKDIGEVERDIHIALIREHYESCNDCRRWLEQVSEAGKGKL